MSQEMNLSSDPYFLEGQVEAIFFQNPNNFYKVILVKVIESDLPHVEEELVVTGSFGEIQEEEIYRFQGKTVQHPRYGLQFAASSYQKEKPSTETGLIHYLSSDKFPGIGKKTAEKIVDLLGLDALDKILADPLVLGKVAGLSLEKRQRLVATLEENLGMEQTLMALTTLGFGMQLALSIYQVYEEEAVEKIKENPYCLVMDVEGIGFAKADHLAQQLKIPADSLKRIEACLVHEVFQQSVQTGNTYIEAKDLLEQTLQTLEKTRPVEIPPEKVANAMIHLVEEGKIQQEGTKIFENSLYFAEWGITTQMERLLTGNPPKHYPEKKLKEAFALTEKSLGITYGASQKEAIQKALENPVFVLTGGPGTGKTTIVRGIVEMYSELNGLSLDINDYKEEAFPVLLGAPTGRAAKRLNETTQLPAGTIHRLLGLTGREKNSNVITKELEGGLIIIDEMSMVDTWLANTLLKAIPTSMQVIFVGDKDQLPSVGPGQVLHDLLAVEKIPKSELTEIYRQEDGSSIIPLAHAIKEGELPEDFTKNQSDRSFFATDATHIPTYIEQIVKKAQQKGYQAKDIQVLAPMYKGPAGINALNQILQNIFNGNPDHTKKEVQYNETVYRIGDKVLQLVNTPELNVFNGDMGVITGLTLAKDTPDKVDELVIEFDGGEVTYKRNEWHKITLAYCCSIHKSQGSEFEVVILPMVSQYFRMLQRNLLYTAITRSKNLLILLGEKSAFQRCVTEISVSRKTTLKEKLTGEVTQESRLALEAFEAGQEVKKTFTEDTPEEKNSQTEIHKPEMKTKDPEFRLTANNLYLIDPMIGMEKITPQQFMTEKSNLYI